MKKYSRSVMSITLIAIFFISYVTPAIAAETIKEPQLQELDQIESYIIEANTKEIIEINGNSVTYYYGDDFVVVKENDVYTTITFNEDKTEFYVNGGEARSTKVSTTVDLDKSTSAKATWTYFDTRTLTFDVAGLTVSASVGLVSGYFGGSVTVSSVTSYIASQIGQSIFPANYGLKFITDSYYGNINPDLGTVDWKYNHSLYHGPDPNFNKYLGKTWTTYNTV